MTEQNPKTYYAVARWCEPDVGKLVVVTTAEWKAVSKWNVGTVLGIGPTEDEAIDRAMFLVAKAETNELQFEQSKETTDA